MKAMLVNNGKHKPDLSAAEIPQPLPGDGDLLIRVHAAGVTPTELLWYPTSHTKEGAMRVNVVPGHEFSGVIAALGKDTHDFNLGDEIDDQLAVWSHCLQKGVSPLVHFRFGLDKDLADQGLEGLRQGRVRDVALVLVELARRKKPA